LELSLTWSNLGKVDHLDRTCTSSNSNVVVVPNNSFSSNF